MVHMTAIHLNAVIGDDRKLIVQLPDDMPTGEVEVVIRSSHLTEVTGQALYNPVREVARRKLMAENALVTSFDVPADARRLSVEERMRIGTLSETTMSSLDIINDDRGEW